MLPILRARGSGNQRRNRAVSVNMIHVTEYLKQSRCPLCESELARDLGPIHYGRSPIEFSSERIDVTGLDARLLECIRCGARRTNPIIPPEMTGKFYEMASAERWSGASERFKSILKKSGVQISKQRARVLDYGCYTGGLLDCFAEQGWNTSGIDLCRAAVEVAKSRGHRVEQGALEALSRFEEPFDVVTLFDVIEHVIDPIDFLDKLAKVIKPGGELWVLTGDANCLASRIFGSRWWYVSFSEHVVYYRLENLDVLFNQCGLTRTMVSRIRYLDHSRLHRAKNYAATSVFMLANPFLSGRTQNRLGVGPPPLFASTDHLFVRGTRPRF